MPAIPSTMVYVGDRTAREEIGKPGLRHLRELANWLGCASERMAFRTAPSLVTRSEAALFGISSPRFAFRTYLSETSFINARRLVKLASAASRVCGRAAPPSSSDPNLRVLPRIPEAVWERMKATGRCVADSLLAPPAHLAEYHVLTAPLGRAYGEPNDFAGTPFLQHTQVGGGMCAQAACFMALTLLERWASAVYGIAEISAISSGARPEQTKVVDVGGLFPQHIVRFFGNPAVGLRAFRQVQTGRMRGQHVLAALRGYLLSDMPVVVLADLGRMSEHLPGGLTPSIYEANRMASPHRLTTLRGNESQHRPSPHAVVAVGCTLAPSDQLLLNDPASFPFLKASVPQLIDARMYVQGAQGPFPSDRLASFQCISVTPKDVMVPLLPFFRGTYEGGEGAPSDPAWDCEPGLLSLAYDYQVASYPTVSGSPEPPRNTANVYQPGEWRLVRVDNDEIASRLRGLPEALVRVFASHAENGTIRSGWYWLQYLELPDARGRTNAAAWLWSAERGPFGRGAVDYLIAWFERRGTTWELGSSPPGGTAEGALAHERASSGEGASASDARRPIPPLTTLKPALLSSFTTLGVSHGRDRAIALAPYREAARVIGVGCLGAEVYTLMEPELGQVDAGPPWWLAWLRRVRGWFPRVSPPRRRPAPFPVPAAETAVEYLARLDGQAIDRLAARIQENLRRYSARPVAIATFIPEIAHPPGTEESQLAIRAGSSAVRLAAALQALGEPVRTVELVAGSRMQGIWAGDHHTAGPSISNFSRREPELFATILDDATVRCHLLRALEQVVGAAPRRRPVFLALELEPGPLFLLNRGDTLLALARAIEDNPSLRSWVGFNLDIAHWKLADIHPDWVRQHKVVHRRIVHAHISGHHPRAHFGDITFAPRGTAQEDLGDLRGQFQNWIELLRERAAERGGEAPDFSGYLSLELEAARDHGTVVEGVEQLHYLLGRPMEPGDVSVWG